MKKPLFQIKNFEILDYLHIEFEMLGIFSEIPSISRGVKFQVLSAPYVYPLVSASVYSCACVD